MPKKHGTVLLTTGKSSVLLETWPETGLGAGTRMATLRSTARRRAVNSLSLTVGQLPSPEFFPLASTRTRSPNVSMRRLRSPLVPKDKKFLTLQVVGGKMGAWRTILDNCMLSEDYQLLDSDSPRWLKIPNRDDQPTLPFYVELVTKGSNPRIPDRPERLKVTQAQLDSPYSYFGVARAFLHDVDESPREELSHLAPLFARALLPASHEAPASLEKLAERYASVIRQSLNRWNVGKATDNDARWIGWLVENRLVTNASNQTPRLGETHCGLPTG